MIRESYDVLLYKRMFNNENDHYLFMICVLYAVLQEDKLQITDENTR